MHEHQRDDPQCEAGAVVLAVDRDDRQHDQVGEDEREHAGERDPARPQHCGERDVADRAHERDDGDQRSENDVLEQPKRRGRIVEERGFEHAIRDEAGEPREREADADLLPEHLPVAAEVVRHVRPCLGGDEPAAERQRARGGGVYVSRLRRESVVASFVLEPPRDEEAKEDRHEDDQDGAAEKLREREPPAEQDPEHEPELPDEVRRRELKRER